LVEDHTSGGNITAHPLAAKNLWRVVHQRFSTS
jgi:hypothetical protein